MTLSYGAGHRKGRSKPRSETFIAREKKHAKEYVQSYTGTVINVSASTQNEVKASAISAPSQSDVIEKRSRTWCAPFIIN